jgi:hypothetical protein
MQNSEKCLSRQFARNATKLKIRQKKIISSKVLRSAIHFNAYCKAKLGLGAL